MILQKVWVVLGSKGSNTLFQLEGHLCVCVSVQGQKSKQLYLFTGLAFEMKVYLSFQCKSPVLLAQIYRNWKLSEGLGGHMGAPSHSPPASSHLMALHWHLPEQIHLSGTQSQSAQIMLNLFLRFNTTKQTSCKSVSVLLKPFLSDVQMLGLDTSRAQPMPSGSEHTGTSPGFLLSWLAVNRNIAGSLMPSPVLCPSSPGQKINSFLLTLPYALQLCREDEGTRLSWMSLCSAS